MKTGYYEVICKCGHVGRNYYVDKSFAVTASSGKEAAAIARNIPRVKHHHSDAIRSVTEVSYERYIEIREENDIDPYFIAQNIQEQRQYEISNVYSETYDNYRKEHENTRANIYDGKEKIRNPKKYNRFNYCEVYA